MLTLRLQPDEGFGLGISSKAPGSRLEIRPVEMDFDYASEFGGTSPEAYERLLLDVIAGDSTLFMRRDSVEASWRFITPILKRWGATATGADPDLCRWLRGARRRPIGFRFARFDSILRPWRPPQCRR